MVKPEYSNDINIVIKPMQEMILHENFDEHMQMLSASSLRIDRFLRHQINGPEDQGSYSCLDNDICPEHLLQALDSHNSCKGDDGKEQAVHRNGYGV